VPPRQPPAAKADGNPPLGLDGYCPVTLIERMQWQKGDVRYGAIHRGRTYLFAGQEEQRRFLAQPDHLSPMLSGNDPVEFVERGFLVPGKREHGLGHGRQIYLFASEQSLRQFADSPGHYVSVVHQAMQQAPRDSRPR